MPGPRSEPQLQHEHSPKEMAVVTPTTEMLVYQALHCREVEILVRRRPWIEDTHQAVTQFAPEPLRQGNCEALLGSCQHRIGHCASDGVAQNPFALAVPEFHATGQRERKLSQVMVE